MNASWFETFYELLNKNLAAAGFSKNWRRTLIPMNFEIMKLFGRIPAPETLLHNLFSKKMAFKLKNVGQNAKTKRFVNRKSNAKSKRQLNEWEERNRPQ